MVESNTQETPDIAEIMAEIRKRVQDDVAANKDTQKPFQGTAADFHSARKAGEIVNSEELRYLNTNYAFGPRLNLDSISSHRPIIGKIIVKFKRKLMTMIWNLLKDYFAAERDFQANLVRLLNDFSKYVDARDAANFWELIRKLDYDIGKISERVERIADEGMGSLQASEGRLASELHEGLNDVRRQLAELAGRSGEENTRLQTLESVTKGFESILARIGKDQDIVHVDSNTEPSSRSDLSYLLLENRSRGSEEEISQRLSIYPEYFKGATNPILDIGQGRGELLALFEKAGIGAYGVDTDQAMCEASAAKGYRVLCGDAISHLRGLKDDTLGGVIGIQVVEHLQREQIEELVALCKKKVVEGGKIIFETVNPCSLIALSSNFYRDLTHVWPLHPDTLSYACEMAGLKVIEVKKLSPVPAEAQLKSIPIGEYMTPRWAHTLELLNQDIQQLNALLYGYQDYCVIAEA